LVAGSKGSRRGLLRSAISLNTIIKTFFGSWRFQFFLFAPPVANRGAKNPQRGSPQRNWARKCGGWAISGMAAEEKCGTAPRGAVV